MNTGKLYPVKIETRAFLAIPETERVFFVQLGWLCNDLMVFHRLLVGSSNADESSEILKCGKSSIFLTSMRLLAGRLNEGWEMLRTSYFGSSISRDYDSALDPLGKKALSDIKKYFSGANAISQVRNSYSFHTDPNELKRSMSSLPDNVELLLYLSEKHGNSLYWFADEVIANGMFSLINGVTMEQAVDELYVNCLNISGRFLEFASHAMRVFVRGHVYLDADIFGEGAIELEDLPSLEEFRFPFFVAEG